MMKISLIIPTCHRPELLRECLNRLEIPPSSLEAAVQVIVTDDSRDGETRSMLERDYPKVQYVEGPRRGPASNRNAGAAAATGDWLIFLDDDCLPSPGFLKAYSDAIGALSGQLVALEGPTLRQGPATSLLWEAPHNPDGGALISCNLAIRQADFVLVGRFDERYPVAAFEDTEFSARFRASGGIVRFVKDAAVVHPLRPIPNPSALAARWAGKAIYAYDQGASPLTVLLWLPWHALRVIQSRFRGQRLSFESLTAAWLFGREWFLILWRTPGWVRRWCLAPRSPFWVRETALRGPAPRFGF